MTIEKPQMTKAKEATSQTNIIWDPSANNILYIFYYVSMPQQPWYQLPDWMLTQRGSMDKPKAEDMPGDYQQPDPQGPPQFDFAYINESLPGEDSDPSHTPHLISNFNFHLRSPQNQPGLDAYVANLGAHLDSELPNNNSDYPSSYRQFNLISVKPLGGSGSTFQYAITYKVTVLGSGPGGPELAVEPPKTVVATYDFSSSTGYYQ